MMHVQMHSFHTYTHALGKYLHIYIYIYIDVSSPSLLKLADMSMQNQGILHIPETWLIHRKRFLNILRWWGRTRKEERDALVGGSIAKSAFIPPFVCLKKHCPFSSPKAITYPLIICREKKKKLIKCRYQFAGNSRDFPISLLG